MDWKVSCQVDEEAFVLSLYDPRDREGWTMIKASVKDYCVARVKRAC
jgi:hypothetical protein